MTLPISSTVDLVVQCIPRDDVGVVVVVIVLFLLLHVDASLVERIHFDVDNASPLAPPVEVDVYVSPKQSQAGLVGNLGEEVYRALVFETWTSKASAWMTIQPSWRLESERLQVEKRWTTRAQQLQSRIFLSPTFVPH